MHVGFCQGGTEWRYGGGVLLFWHSVLKSNISLAAWYNIFTPVGEYTNVQHCKLQLIKDYLVRTVYLAQSFSDSKCSLVKRIVASLRRKKTLYI